MFVDFGGCATVLVWVCCSFCGVLTAMVVLVSGRCFFSGGFAWVCLFSVVCGFCF